MVIKKERTAKQKENARLMLEKRRKTLDLRSNKEDEGITLKIAKSRVRSKEPRPKPVPKIKEVIIEDDEEEDEEPAKKFQGRKPKIIAIDQYQQVCKELDAAKDALAAVGHELALLKKRTN